MIQGKLVALRPVKRADKEHFLRWFNDPEVTQYLHMYLPMNEIAEDKYIEKIGTPEMPNDIMFIIEAVDGKTPGPIGTVGLSSIHWKDHAAVFGISVGEKDYWSRGYGTEAAQLIIRYAFEQVNFHRITSSVAAFNERSLRMHRKIGFSEEARQREIVFKNGAWHDRVFFGLLKDEWLAFRQP